ncbi:hypothetical protein [Blastochloris sulfoviridis]|uniref:Uncharacterized protein n=1 Tax=Blastochloris sulfoviridis TaxID=50712 RepID=A0A5M6HIK4_9HYPH|nr:hypothetical protein [Blastochloris sulfoviridis]KAA5595595.1 hypothetical protein F1193_16460 [Blastochloris sulfoviridis]
MALKTQDATIDLTEAPMDGLLRRMFETVVTTGQLTVVTAQGRRYRFGDGTPPEVAIRFTSPGWQQGNRR